MQYFTTYICSSVFFNIITGDNDKYLGWKFLFFGKTKKKFKFKDGFSDDSYWIIINKICNVIDYATGLEEWASRTALPNSFPVVFAVFLIKPLTPND